MKNLIRFLAIIFVALLFAYNAAAQTDPDKPICISRDAAEACATNAVKVKALEAQIAALEQALKDKDAVINDLKVEVDRTSGRIESCEKNDASNRAIIEILIKNARPKRIGLINIF
jgi:hypothetical protein